jgi:hypothetical protein
MKANATIAVLTAGCLVAGCASDGLSPRETPGRDYSLYVNSMYELPASHTRRAPAELRFPTQLAVAQIGEVAPPAEMLRELRKQTTLFARVEGLPGTTSAPVDRHARWNLDDNAPAAGAREHLRGMCRLARDMGLTHLLVFGGTIDHATNTTGLAAADLTIIGAFVMPSREIRATARASAALIDVESESVVLIASADNDRTKLTPAIGQDNDRLKLMQSMRDTLIDELTTNFIAQCSQRAGLPVAASAAAR